MPRKKQGKKTMRKGKRAFRKGKKISTYARVEPIQTRSGLVGFPTNRVVKMRYCQQDLLTSTSGALITKLFKANSIFDPDQAVGGHQPLGYDQWSAFYNHYVVIGSKINFEVAWSAGTTTPVTVGVYLSDDTSLAGTTALELQEQGKSRNLVLAPSLSNPTRSLNLGYSAKKFFNVNDIKDNLDRLGAEFSSDPGELAYFAIYMESTDEGSTSSVRVVTTIDYIVIMSEPKELPQS